MIGRRAVIGLCMLCALAFSAFAAAGASAATSGTTAVTCAKLSTPATGPAGFSDAHCKTGVAESVAAAYAHKAITTETKITLTNAGTGAETKTAEPTKLHGVSAGLELELEATEVTGTGTMKNSLTGEVHKASGSGKIVYSGVTVLKPAGRSCVVKGGKVETVELAAETVESGLKFAPKTGETFATFTVESCTKPELNKAYNVTGSIIGTPEGATTVFTRAGTTEQGTLLLGGQKAGIAGKVTIKGESGDGLALTKAPFTVRP